MIKRRFGVGSILLGVLGGVLLTFTPGSFFILCLSGLVLYLVLRITAAEDKRFVAWVFILGLALRMFTALFLDVVAFTFFKGATMENLSRSEPPNDNNEWILKERLRVFLKMPDSDYYSSRGFIYAAYVNGMDNVVTRHYLGLAGKQYGWSIYLYVIGFFYYLFNYSPIAVMFINCLIGALGAFFIYKVSLNFGKIVSRVAFLLAAFLPNLVIWSTANFKEPSYIFLNLLSLWAIIRYFETKKLYYLGVLLFALLVELKLTQAEAWLILFIPVILSVIFYFIPKRTIILVLIMGFIMTTLIQKNQFFIQHFKQDIISKLYVKHIGHINTPGISYRVLSDKYYKNSDLIGQIENVELASAVLKSFTHFLFEPFPNRLIYKNFIFLYFPTLLWYILLLFFFYGLACMSGYSRECLIPLYCFLFSSSFVIALTSGNVGTLIRHRDMATPFFLIISSVGIAHSFLNKNVAVSGNKHIMSVE